MLSKRFKVSLMFRMFNVLSYSILGVFMVLPPGRAPIKHNNPQGSERIHMMVLQWHLIACNGMEQIQVE
jgi:hypothetical protein